MTQIVRTDAYDFVVCGGGASGIACALSAARKGLSVALAEQFGCLGGAATLAGVNHLNGGRKLDEQTGRHVRVVGGVFDEITDCLIRQGNAIEPDTIDLTFNPFGWYPRMASGITFEDTAFKILTESLCTQAGVRIYYFTSLTEAQVENGRVTSVTVHNKDGFVRLCAPYFADCTGDADLCDLSGVPCEKGRKEDGLMTPCSLEMHVEGVDTQRFVQYQNDHQSPKLVEIIERLKKEGAWAFPYEIFVAIRMMEKDVFMVNTIRQVGVDGTSEASISKAMMEGRKENLALLSIMKAHFPGFENARLRKMADVLGVRETRRLKGRYTVTIEDALHGARFEDRIGATTYNFDLPDPKRPSYDSMMGDAKTPNAQRKHVVIQIPYRSLLPCDVANLIVAGRCISVEREVLGPVRIMGPCMMTGQAAGTAVSQAKPIGLPLADVDIPKLQQTLWADGLLDPQVLPFS